MGRLRPVRQQQPETNAIRINAAHLVLTSWTCCAYYVLRTTHWVLRKGVSRNTQYSSASILNVGNLLAPRWGQVVLPVRRGGGLCIPGPPPASRRSYRGLSRPC